MNNEPYEPCEYCGGQGITFDSNDEGRTFIQVICPCCQGVGWYENQNGKGKGK